MSNLLQNVLSSNHQQSVLEADKKSDEHRIPSYDEIAAKLQRLATAERAAVTEHSESSTDEDDEIVGVVSSTATPKRLHSEAPSPARTLNSSGALSSSSSKLKESTAESLSPRGKAKKLKAPKNPRDPVRVLPTELVQRIFADLDVKDLASSSRVCLKWNKSQSLNFIWFRHYRKQELRDTELPNGQWTRKESKENWRVLFNKAAKELSASDISHGSRYGYATPPAQYHGSRASMSGAATPTRKEIREERWAEEEALANSSAGKLEAREAYKEMGGRKAKSKNKVVTRDRGGWTESGDA